MGRGAEEFHSPELQKSGMRIKVTAAGLREVASVEDIDVTGRTFSREGLNQIRQMVEEKRVDVVAVYDLSRLGRNTAEALAFIRWLREHGVGIISTREQIDDTPEGQFMLGQFLGMAQLFSDQMSRRWQDVLALRVRNGKLHGRPVVGYIRVPIADAPIGRHGHQPTQVIEDPVMGPAMSRAFADFDEGVALTKIRNTIHELTGRWVNRNTLRSALRNPTYLGKALLWGTGNHRAPGMLETAAEIFDGEHPALVGQEVFDRVQVRLRAEYHVKERKLLAFSWSLANIAVCAHCELPLGMHYKVVSKTNREKPDRMRCGARDRVIPIDCPGVGVPYLERVEDETFVQIADWAVRLEADPGSAMRPRADVATDLRPTLEKFLADNVAAQAKLVGAWVAGGGPDEAYRTNIADLIEEQAALRVRVADLGVDDPAPEPPEIAALARRVVALRHEADAMERRQLIASVVSRVVVRKAEFWREPEADRTTVEFRW